MHVGLLHIELTIDDARSLKDKRRVVKSVRDSLARDSAMSVAEVGSLDLWNRAELGVAVCASSSPIAGQLLDRALAKTERRADARVTDVSRRVLSLDEFDDSDASALWTPEESRREGAA